jgi:hypothetical protein
VEEKDRAEERRETMSRKPQDTAALEIKFGVELETFVPISCGFDIGHYHGNTLVAEGKALLGGATIPAPSFNGMRWRADADGSILAEPGFKACEFVSPILHGEQGVIALVQAIQFLNNVGARVNKSCGCHVTVGIPGVLGLPRTGLGQQDQQKAAHFLRKLTRIVRRHAWAVYAQTGTSRHESGYCKPIPDLAGTITNDLLYEPNQLKRQTLVNQCGRGMLNMLKSFSNSSSAIEFRAFAGTLNERKILHHVATCIGLMRKAHIAKIVTPFEKPGQRKPKDAPSAVRFLWADLGWADDVPGLDCALGQFGLLHSDFERYSPVALKMASKFEAKHPKADL